jgi:hypothetical protein
VRLAALCTIFLLLAGCGGASRLSEKTLQQETETVQSAAAEGALLAADVARERTTEPFARIHSGQLAEQATKAAETLRGGTTRPGLEDEHRRALRAALDVERALEKLHAEPANQDLARRLERELQELSR